jgi:hypothetical protein
MDMDIDHPRHHEQAARLNASDGRVILWGDQRDLAARHVNACTKTARRYEDHASIDGEIERL